MSKTAKQAFVAASYFEDGKWYSFNADDVVNWPRYSAKEEIPEDQKEDYDPRDWAELFPEEGEDVDLENFNILSIGDDEIVIVCGGDWQPPTKITLRMVNGELTAAEVEKFADFEDGLGEDEITAALPEVI
jgi:hypothetical protein